MLSRASICSTWKEKNLMLSLHSSVWNVVFLCLRIMYGSQQVFHLRSKLIHFVQVLQAEITWCHTQLWRKTHLVLDEAQYVANLSFTESCLEDMLQWRIAVYCSSSVIFPHLEPSSKVFANSQGYSQSGFIRVKYRHKTQEAQFHYFICQMGIS